MWAVKYRPRSVDQVLGQDFPKSVIKGALLRYRLPGVNSLSWLVSGSYGCGKTTITRIVAKSLACHNPTPLGEACQTCSSCLSIDADNSSNYTEIDAASRSGVKDIRELIQEVSLAPIGGARYRTIALDEAHALSTPAQNVLLKTVEEPSPSTHIMFVTTEPEKLLETIRSRCVQIELTPIDKSLLVKHLADVCQLESISFELPALELIVSQTRGHARDALTLSEQISLIGSITLQSVRQSLHLDLDERIFLLLRPLGIDGDALQDQVQTLIQQYSAQQIWEAVCRFIKRAQHCRLAPNRVTQSDQLKALVDRYGDKLTVAVEWILSKGEIFFVRTDTDLVVALSVLQDHLGVGNATEEKSKNRKFGPTKRSLASNNLKTPETVYDPDQFAKSLGFELDS